MNKRKLIYLCLFFIGFQTYAPSELFAQRFNSKIKTPEKKTPEADPTTKVFSIYPLRGSVNYIMLGMDSKIASNKSIKVIAGYNYFDEPMVDGYTFQQKGVRLEVQLKFYMSKKNKVFDGWYMAPVVGVKHASFLAYNFSGPFNYRESASSFMLGVIAGYQFPVGKKFNAEIYFGEVIKKSSGSYQIANKFIDGYANAVGIHAGFCIGFAL